MKVAAVRLERPWAMITISYPRLQMIFVSQLSTTHCVCAEVQAPGLSIYVVSCYFQYSDEIEGHLRHLEKVFHSLRGERLIMAVDANARLSLWGSRRLTKEKGRSFKIFIRAFGLKIINEFHQGLTFETRRGSSFIDVILVSPQISQLIGTWKVRQEWITSNHSRGDRVEDTKNSK